MLHERCDGVPECVEIRVTLRRYWNPLHFLPYEEILEIMLHELAHNTHPDHTPAFYRLLQQYQRVWREAGWSI